MKRLPILLCLLPLTACMTVTGEEAPERTGPQRELAGTAWAAVSIDGRSVQAGIESTVVFQGDRVGGSAGCNRYSAVLESQGTALHIGDIVATKMACAPAAMDQEQRFLGALEVVAAYRWTDGSLILLDVDGQERLRLIHSAEPR
ncbi:MAG TPA: META domain-containing protein [Gammaproteobacteria bacterium]|nr:META domain-containing protein [Gammaproteobacteria bacterium]